VGERTDGGGVGSFGFCGGASERGLGNPDVAEEEEAGEMEEDAAEVVSEADWRPPCRLSTESRESGRGRLPSRLAERDSRFKRAGERPVTLSRDP